jgi:plasmid stabilization system protein ParE
MASLIWSDFAIECLRGIRDYIARDSPQSAQRVIEGIYDRTGILRQFPELGYKHQDSDFGDVRVLLYGHYRISYAYDGQAVRVLGVYHSAMNNY